MKHLEHGFNVGFYAPGIGLDGPIDCAIDRGGMTVTLNDDFRVYLPGVGLIVVPKGTKTDFASSPRFLWRIVPPWGNYLPAAVVHDYLYASGLFSRAMADLIFLELMQRLGVPWWKSGAMYWALLAFGWLAWRACRKLRK